MSSKPIHEGRDVTRLLEHNHCPIRLGKGSHRVAQLPNGQILTYYEHGEFPRGMLHNLLKILKTAGLILLAGIVCRVSLGLP
jgi:uncharacterized protein (DUF3820 family)